MTIGEARIEGSPAINYDGAQPGVRVSLGGRTSLKLVSARLPSKRMAPAPDAADLLALWHGLQSPLLTMADAVAARFGDRALARGSRRGCA